MNNAIWKRGFDLLCVVPGLLLLAPLLLLLALWVKLDSSGPVLFRQTRVGRGGQPFAILKFRSMRAAPGGLALTVGADQRITRSGRFLRRFKLDELPQLLNILRGEMSLVGPRPEVPEYVAHYPPELRAEVLSVAPGLTDFASILLSQESELLAAQEEPERAYIEKILPVKLAWQQYYARQHSLWLDLRLIMRTFTKVLSSAPELDIERLPRPPL